jgi:hypothetical protein
MEASSNPDPRFHVKRIEDKLSELAEHLRADIETVNEPKAQALFETSAEVLLGLRTAFSHYQTGSEKAMRPADKS